MIVFLNENVNFKSLFVYKSMKKQTSGLLYNNDQNKTELYVCMMTVIYLLSEKKNVRSITDY